MGDNSNNKNTGLKVALALVSIFLIVSLIAVYYVYTNPPNTQDQISSLQNQKASLENQVTDLQSQINDLENQIETLESQQTEDGGTDLQSQINDLQSQLDGLQTTYDNYVSTHSYSNSEYNNLVSEVTTLGGQIASLQNEVDSLKASKLVTRLGVSDQRPFLQTPYFHVSGEVWNVGTNTAINCKLHVILYQGSVVAEDTYINLGTISGEYFTSVDERVYYQGSSLTSWSVSPEWD